MTMMWEGQIPRPEKGFRRVLFRTEGDPPPMCQNHPLRLGFNGTDLCVECHIAVLGELLKGGDESG
jgi:hypothetical protein